MADKIELLQLKKEIERHNKLYHEQDNPEISDAEYDALYQRLKELENLLGADQDSPTQQVGAPSSRKFEKHNHLKPMLSLSNVCLLYTSPSPRDWMVSRMPSSA